MTREEAVKEIEKAFEPAFANYIITALAEGATISDKEPTTKNDLGVDCISRQEVLNIAKASKSNWIDNSILFKRVNELPSITPQDTRWIPVSERLPEEQDEYLVTNKGEI